jgi:uncharacterized protein
MNISPSMTAREKMDARFAYNTETNLDIQEKGEEVFDGIVVHDIDFRGASGKRIAAYLITPIVGHGFPGVVMVHPLPGNRKSFLDEAIGLAGRRICSITINAPWSEGMDWGRKMGDPEHDRKEFIGMVKDLRRSLDVLTAQLVIDPRKLGYIGHSLGALCGGVLSGVDRRAKALVLMSGTTSFSEVAKVNIPDISEQEFAEYRRTMKDIDPLGFVAQAKPAKLMFQMGKQEEYFARQNMQTLADAASEPKDVRWYDAGHMLNEQARKDRDDWLVEELFH